MQHPRYGSRSFKRSLGPVVLFAAFCVPGPLTASAATVSVDCSGATPGAFTSITAALATLDPAGPNTVNVSGECSNEGLVISGHSQLTIQAGPSPTATVSHVETACDAPAAGAPANQRVLLVLDSHQVLFVGLTFRGGQGVAADQGSTVTFRGVTIENSRGNGLNVGSGVVGLQGRAGMTATPNTIRNNCGAGISVGVLGIASLNSGNTIQGNRIGLDVAGTASLGAGSDQILVEGNRGYGIRVFDGRVNLGGQTTVQNNGTDPALLAQAGIWAGVNAIVDAGGGVKVLGNTGPGIWADISATVLLGPIVNPAASVPITISGNTEEGIRLTHMSRANTFAGNSITGNGGKDATCDGTSLIFGDVKDIASIQCSNVEKIKK